MVKLEESKTLGRKMRRDDIPDLAVPTWALVHDAVKANKAEEALELISYGCSETERVHDLVVSFVESLISYIASLGEDQLEKAVRARSYSRMKQFLATPMAAEESVQYCAEMQRGHFGKLTVTEEADRYVMKCDPCGTGGKLRRARNLEATKKAHPWSWGKVGVPYYCTHCCFQWEIIPIEIQGYPVRITIPGDKPEDPCTSLFYKKPELIPESYFTRVGKKRPER